MMGSFVRFFRKFRKKKAQQDELEYRMKLADLRRQTSVFRQTAERASREAYELNISGRHAEAVAKAVEAANAQKAYKIAERNMLNCESTHAQAKTQQSLTQLMNTCEQISKEVLGQVDMDAAFKAQTRMMRMNSEVEEAQESMTTFQESFITDGETVGNTMVGEDALAEIMAAYAPEQPVQEAPVQEVPVREAQQQSEEALDIPEQAKGVTEVVDSQAALAHMEWLNQRRRELAEIS